MTKRYAFELTDDDIDILRELAESWGLSMTDAIRKSIRQHEFLLRESKGKTLLIRDGRSYSEILLEIRMARERRAKSWFDRLFPFRTSTL